MGKLVVLKFGKHNLATGVAVGLQIGEENARPSSEVVGELPPDPELWQQLQQWQTLYRSLDFAGRPIGLPKPAVPTSVTACRQAAEQLGDRLNHWLQADSFRPIREKWLEKLLPTDPIRIILQTEDPDIIKLPWHLWEILDRYPNAQMALSAPAYEQMNRAKPANAKVKILALLGNSSGIDLQSDRQQLEQLPAAVTFLVEPALPDLTDRLWDQHWDILFFAGHSSSQANSGRIFINATESLTMGQLRYGLRKAVDQGLQLAIFNSCDGLGLAQELADLQIPQVIVMSEPVPDRVAQAFLQHFLQAYSQGKPLYMAVRQARERLQGLENQFPCASWLPIISQNLAEQPLTWQELAGKSVRPWRRFGSLLAAGVLMTGLMSGARFLKLLQPLELQAYDHLLSLRAPEKPDNRLLVVTITEEDVQSQGKEPRRGSLSESYLLKLLNKLEAANPLAIGLDIYRDYPVENMPQLADRLQQSDNLIGICKVSDPKIERVGVKPPPEINSDRLGFSDLIFDPDGVVRRHLLALTPPPNSVCTAPYSFSVQLALRYLSQENITLQFAPDGAWQLGKVRLSPLESHSGGYQGIDAWGHQIFLNYRAEPQAIAPRVTLTQVLSNQIAPSAIQDRIVLIGTTAESFQDYSLTPYHNQFGKQKIPGVMLQAQQISQLLSATLEGRSMIWTLTWWQDMLWILPWAIGGGLATGWVAGNKKWLILGLLGGGVILLYGVCVLAFGFWGLWLPLIPATLAFAGNAIGVQLIKSSRFNSKFL